DRCCRSDAHRALPAHDQRSPDSNRRSDGYTDAPVAARFTLNAETQRGAFSKQDEHHDRNDHAEGTPGDDLSQCMAFEMKASYSYQDDQRQNQGGPQRTKKGESGYHRPGNAHGMNADLPH